MIESVVDERASAAAIERLRAAAELRASADAIEAQAILDLAGEHQWMEGDEYTVVGLRPVRIGADGTPLIDETLPCEVAAALAMSVDAAGWLIRDVLNLHSRHPHTWQAVQDRRLPLWRARQLAELAAGTGLGFGESLLVDAKIADALGRVGWRRVMRLFRAAMIEVAPGKVIAIAERHRANRYLRIQPHEDDPASSLVAGRVETADALLFDDLVERITDALIIEGAWEAREVLRARAVGIVADPEAALQLLHATSHRPLPQRASDEPPPALPEPDPARLHEPVFDEGPARHGLDTLRHVPPMPDPPPPRPTGRRLRRPTAKVFVHVSTDVLAEGGPARIEKLGPVLVDELSHVVGHHDITLTPVLYIGGQETAVDGYDIPESMKDTVRIRDRHDIFPYSSREARSCDLDHTIAYTPDGPPGQTRPSNLGPTSRRAHRAKTHGRWQLEQPQPGTFCWRTPRGQIYEVGPHGTTNLTPRVTRQSGGSRPPPHGQA